MLLRLLDEEELFTAPELFLGVEVDVRVVVPLLLEERDVELLTPLVPLPLVGLNLMVVPLSVLESSPLVAGLGVMLPPLSRFAPFCTVPAVGRAVGRTDEEEVVPFVVEIISSPPLPPRRSL